MMTIGDLIKKKRLENNISARELSRRSGVSQPYLSQLETGKNDNPSLNAIDKLSKGLGVTLLELLIDSGYINESDVNKEKEG
ncbi:MAG: helix-turn-helix transcriptional regulator [Niallia sp.]